MAYDLPLELSLKDFHVKVMLVDLLLAGALGLGLVTFFVHKHADLVRSSHALDCIGLEILVGVARRACGRLVEVTSTVDFTVDSWVRVDGGIGLTAFLVHEHEDLVRGSHAFDCLGLAHLSRTSPPPPTSSSNPPSSLHVKASFDATDGIRTKVAH